MKIHFILTLSALLFGSLNAQASVWEDTESWSVAYEEKYVEWIASNAVRENMFTSASSPYYGINTDCADTAYAIRAIFAFEHKLPFAIINPSGSRDVSKSLNNKTSKFDYRGPENKRLVALINEIGESVGTENLTRYDTYPVAIKSIKGGTIFTYKMRARFGKFIRHAYNIKSVNPIGSYDVIYSTQANQAKRGDLLRRRDRDLENLPSDPWGFRRFKWPEHIGQSISVIPAELEASNEQFDLAKSLGSGFFKYVSKQLATSSETSGERLARVFKNVCQETQARIMYVNEALEYNRKTGNSCMDYTNYDAYSTPARDGALKDMFLNLESTFKGAKSQGGVDPIMLGFAEYMFTGSGSSVQAELQAACPIEYRPGVTIDLATFWNRMKNDRISNHPNDIVEVRWGETTKPATRCKRWY